MINTMTTFISHHAQQDADAPRHVTYPREYKSNPMYQPKNY